MKNPNETRTFWSESTTTTVITFHYTSASVCSGDFESICKAYPDAQIEKVDSNTTKVTYQK